MGVRMMVFAKAPVKGRVKTRLRPALGAVGAARVYRRLLEKTLANAAAAQAEALELWVAPGLGHPYVRRLADRYGASLRPQPGGDLGRRMHRALADAARNGMEGIIIGGDCASVSVPDLKAAMAAVQARRLVFKPADDGGYLLVGGNPAPAGLFQAIPWGTSSVMGRTRARLRRLGLPWTELSPGWDVDRPGDLRRVARAGLLRFGVVTR